jgi:uncharacterized caspase-like protein
MQMKSSQFSVFSFAQNSKLRTQNSLVLALRLVFCILCLPLSARAQDKGFVVTGSKDLAQSIASIQGTRWALLIGIANYPSVEGFEIQQLKAPVKDVSALAAFLKDPKKGGFDPDHVFTLTDEEATRRNILMKLNEIASKAGPEDMVIFYFSGHGTRDMKHGLTYLIPYDHDLSDLGTTCIRFSDLANKIRDMEASKVVVILDACHSGGVKPKGARAAVETGIVERYDEEFRKAEGRPLLLSSDESEVSWETEENGIFTRFLLEGLNGKADTNPEDGIVTFTEAAEYVEEAVPKYTRENFPREQRPMRRYDFGQVRGDIPLAIDWPDHEAFRQEQQQLLDKRNTAILRASLAGLDQTLKEFSLQVAKSSYRKALDLDDEPPTEQERLLLQEIDGLQAGTLPAADYIELARAVYNLVPARSLTQLRVAATPADARVTLAPADAPGSVARPSEPNVYQVPQGQYRLSVKRPGYAQHSRELTLDKKSEVVEVTLERLMGTLQLQVDPADATVTVTPLKIDAPDSQIRVSKPVRIPPTGERKLPVGTYRVLAEKEGYESAVEEPVEIDVDVSIRLKLTLKPIKPPKPETATISAPDLPDGTRVFVDGESVTLPHELPPGTHRIRLERDGFQPIHRSEVLTSGQSLSLRPEWVPTTPLTPQDIPKLSPAFASPRGLTGGLKAAVSGATFYGDDVDDSFYLAPGFCAGGFITYRINDTLAIQPEIMFTMKGTKEEYWWSESEEVSWDDTGEEWWDEEIWWSEAQGVWRNETEEDWWEEPGEITETLNYLEIPVLARLTTPGQGKIKPTLFAGPALAIYLGGKYKYEDQYEEYEGDIEELGIEPKSVDFGIVLGLGVDLSLGQGKLAFETRFTVGLASIDQYGSDVRNTVGSIMIGYSFK